MFNKFRIFINLRISVHLKELNKDKGGNFAEVYYLDCICNNELCNGLSSVEIFTTFRLWLNLSCKNKVHAR